MQNLKNFMKMTGFNLLISPAPVLLFLFLHSIALFVVAYCGFIVLYNVYMCLMYRRDISLLLLPFSHIAAFLILVGLHEIMRLIFGDEDIILEGIFSLQTRVFYTLIWFGSALVIAGIVKIVTVVAEKQRGKSEEDV